MLIVCNGMIRSGSTLQYNFVSKLVDKTNNGFIHGYVSSEQYCYMKEKINLWSNDDKMHVIKTHEILPNLDVLDRDKKIKIFYIYRNVREVAVSANKKWGYDINKTYQVIDDSLNIYESLTKLSNICRQKYENVISDYNESILEIADFLNIHVNEGIINQIISECSLNIVEEQMHERQKKLTSRFILILRRAGIVHIFGKILRALNIKGPIYHAIKNKVSGYDENTLLHLDHIACKTKKTTLEHAELNRLEKKYSHWLEQHGYCD